MKITNPNNLPADIVRAVEISINKYDAGKSDISVTSLLKPPHMGQLERKYRKELQEYAVPVEEMLPIFTGQAMHTAIEAGAGEDDIVERRFFTEFEGKIISGQIDHLSPDGVLRDNKETQTYGLTEGHTVAAKKEWVNQLNIYKWLIERETDLKVTRLTVFANVKDWSRAKLRNAERNGFPYPAERGVILEVPIIPDIEERIKKQMALHFGEEVEACSDDDRWPKTKKPWAVVKKLGGKAMRIFKTEEEAKECQKIKGGIIEKREEGYNRCESYCSVSEYCELYQNELKEKEEGKKNELEGKGTKGNGI